MSFIFKIFNLGQVEGEAGEQSTKQEHVLNVLGSRQRRFKTNRVRLHQFHTECEISG